MIRLRGHCCWLRSRASRARRQSSRRSAYCVQEDQVEGLCSIGVDGGLPVVDGCDLRVDPGHVSIRTSRLKRIWSAPARGRRQTRSARSRPRALAALLRGKCSPGIGDGRSIDVELALSGLSMLVSAFRSRPAGPRSHRRNWSPRQAQSGLPWSPTSRRGNESVAGADASANTARAASSLRCRSFSGRTRASCRHRRRSARDVFGRSSRRQQRLCPVVSTARAPAAASAQTGSTHAKVNSGPWPGQLVTDGAPSSRRPASASGEADACAAEVPRRRLVGLRERLEDRRQLVWDADAGVGHANEGFWRGVAPLQRARSG